jgi:hypothetical protein
MTTSKKAVIASQSVLLLTLIICGLLSPEVITRFPQGGLSNFGTETTTLPVFSVGFWAAIILLAIAGSHTKDKLVKSVLVGNALLLAVLVLSTYPYKINEFYENLHIVVGFTVAIYQLVTSFMLLYHFGLNFFNKLALFLIGLSVLAGLSTIFWVGLLFTAQLLGGVSYAILLINNCSKESVV